MHNRIIVILFTCLAMATASFAESRRTMKVDSIGCNTKDNHKRAFSMIVSKDFEALARFILTGKCKMLNKDEVVYLQDVTVFSGLAKVRSKGQTVDWWTRLEDLNR